jgi:hypothetical protein
MTERNFCADAKLTRQAILKRKPPHQSQADGPQDSTDPHGTRVENR